MHVHLLWMVMEQARLCSQEHTCSGRPAVTHTGIPASATGPVVTTCTAELVGLEHGPLQPLMGLGDTLSLTTPVKHIVHSGSLSLSPGPESGSVCAPLSGGSSGWVPLEDCGGNRSSYLVERSVLFRSPDCGILLLSEGCWGAAGEGWRKSD